MVRDPVCDMEIDDAEAKGQGLMSEHEGKKYFFCSSGCKREFEMDPEMYAMPDAQSRASDDGMGDYPSANE